MRRRDLFEEAFDLGFAADESCWQPKADVYRTPRGWFVKLDIAGVRAQDVEVAATGGSIVVRGTRRDMHVGEGYDPYRVEITYSEFERRIDLPCQTGRCLLEVEVRDGLLLIFLTES